MPTQSPHRLEVWGISLASPADLTRCLAVLDAGEQARADRFRFPEHRRRFVVAHAAVRCILARRLGVAPGALQFAANAHGKPFLASHGAPVFNLSHSHEMALCAVSEAGELGVDIEWCRELPHADLARRFFAPDESSALAALAQHEQVAGFFACWTRKEAYIKAKGLGLSLPLDAFSMSADPHRAPALLSSRHEASDVGRYRFWEVPVAPGYRATLAYRGSEAAMPDYFDWPSSCSLAAS